MIVPKVNFYGEHAKGQFREVSISSTLFWIAHRRYRELGSFEPTLPWQPQLHRSQSRGYYFSVANRSSTRPITRRTCDPTIRIVAVRKKKRERGSDLPPARHRRVGPHRAFHSFRTMRRVFHPRRRPVNSRGLSPPARKFTSGTREGTGTEDIERQRVYTRS